MTPYEQVKQIAASLDPPALEAVRRELEQRCAPLRDEGEPEGSSPISDSEDVAVRAQVSAVFDGSTIGLVKTCCEVRLALSQLAEAIGEVV